MFRGPRLPVVFVLFVSLMLPPHMTASAQRRRNSELKSRVSHVKQDLIQLNAGRRDGIEKGDAFAVFAPAPSSRHLGDVEVVTTSEDQSVVRGMKRSGFLREGDDVVLRRLAKATPRNPGSPAASGARTQPRRPGQTARDLSPASVRNPVGIWREWHRTNDVPVRGKMTGFINGIVIVQRESGSFVSIPASNLSAADRDFIGEGTIGESLAAKSKPKGKWKVEVKLVDGSKVNGFMQPYPRPSNGNLRLLVPDGRSYASQDIRVARIDEIKVIQPKRFVAKYDRRREQFYAKRNASGPARQAKPPAGSQPNQGYDPWWAWKSLAGPLRKYNDKFGDPDHPTVLSLVLKWQDVAKLDAQIKAARQRGDHATVKRLQQQAQPHVDQFKVDLLKALGEGAKETLRQEFGLNDDSDYDKQTATLGEIMNSVSPGKRKGQP